MESTAANLILTGVVAYLLGSLSGARIVGGARLSDDVLRRTTVVLDATGEAVERDGVSASSLQAHGGASQGLRAGSIDIVKALVPTLVAALLFDGSAAPAVAAGAAMLGHVYPVYHRFVGGFGISPLLGGLVIVDWRAGLVAILVFVLMGLAAGSAYLAFEVWPIGLIAWFALFGDGWQLAYAVVANLLYWTRSWDETRGAWRAYRKDGRPWRERVADFKKYPDYQVPQ